MKKLLWISVALTILAVAGCTVLTAVDPNTGQTITSYGLDPNNAVVQTLDTVAEVGTGIGVAVAPFLGGTAALVLSGLAGAFAAWKKVSAKLKVARTLGKQMTATTTALVTAIETFKTLSPDAWNTLGEKITEQLTKQGVDAEKIKEIINAIRASLT
ncbi:MAG: hypothetical protein ABFD89_12715 [Bryobacteraceae bacterium]